MMHHCIRIGNYATQHGTAAATRHFEHELKRKLPESTIRNIKRKYVAATVQTSGEITDLPTSSRGRPRVHWVKRTSLINLQSTNSPLFLGLKNRQIKTPPNF